MSVPLPLDPLFILRNCKELFFLIFFKSSKRFDTLELTAFILLDRLQKDNGGVAEWLKAPVC
jgi:hypothetical protein